MEDLVATDLEEEKEGVDSVEEILEDLEDQLKCMMPSAVNAERNARFHSNLLEPSRFFAAIASGKARVQETVR